MLICNTDFIVIENSHVWQMQRIADNVRGKDAHAHAFKIKEQPPPSKNFCLKAISLEQLLLLAMKRRLLLCKSRIDSDFDFGLFQCFFNAAKKKYISVDLFYNVDNGR